MTWVVLLYDTRSTVARSNDSKFVHKSSKQDHVMQRKLQNSNYATRTLCFDETPHPRVNVPSELTGALRNCSRFTGEYLWQGVFLK